MKILQLFLFSIIALSMLVGIVSSLATTPPNISNPQAPQEHHGSSKKCYTRWAYNSENKEFVKLDMYKKYEWKHPITGETKAITKNIYGFKCKTLEKKPAMNDKSAIINYNLSPIPYDWTPRNK